MAGFFKIDRRILEWEWYSDINVRLLWYHLLAIVNYKDLKWRGKVIRKGQLVTSYEILSVGSGLSVQQTRTALEKLKSTGEILINPTNKYTIITICKWGFYQNGEDVEQQSNNIQITNEQQSNNIQITTSKERKEYKERKEINNSLSPHTCAYACESENPEEVKWLAQMKRGFTAWQADACRTLKIDQETLTRYIEEFEVEQRAKSMVHHSWADITSHFIDWGRIHREFELKQQKQESYGKRNDNRFGVEPSKDANYYEPI